MSVFQAEPTSSSQEGQSWSADLDEQPDEAAAALWGGEAGPALGSALATVRGVLIIRTSWRIQRFSRNIGDLAPVRAAPDLRVLSQRS